MNLKQEICEPMGIPTFYAIEFFSLDLGSYSLHSSEKETNSGTAARTDKS
jgi:hypothetical protein